MEKIFKLNQMHNQMLYRMLYQMLNQIYHKPKVGQKKNCQNGIDL